MDNSHLLKSHPPSIKSYMSLSCPFTQFFIYLNFSSTSFSLLLLCEQFTFFQASPSKHICPSIKSYACLSWPFTQFFIYLNFSSPSFPLFLLCGQFTFSQTSLSKHIFSNIKSYPSLIVNHALIFYNKIFCKFM